MNLDIIIQKRNSLEQKIISLLDSSLEHLLWKTCHYKIIQDYRSQKNPKAIASLRSFLTDSTVFYLDLIHKITIYYDLTTVNDIVCKRLDVYCTENSERELLASNPNPTHDMKIRATQTVHRCLIYLGDLARYRESVSDRKEKRWSLSRNFYTLAIWLLPNIGNPFNQLAVIDTYEGNELGAVDYYFSSLAVEIPFQTALDNLIVLFQNNMKKSNSTSTFYFILMHGYLLADKNENMFLSSKTEFLNRFTQDLKSNILNRAQLNHFIKISLAQLYIQKLSHSESAVYVEYLVHEIATIIFQAVIEGFLISDCSLSAAKIYLQYLISFAEIPKLYKETLVKYLNIISLLGYPEKGVLREDVEIQGFAPLNLCAIDLDLLNENASEEIGIRINQILQLGVDLCQFGLYKSQKEDVDTIIFSSVPISDSIIEDDESCMSQCIPHPATAEIIDDMDGEEDPEEIVVYTGRKSVVPSPTPDSFWKSHFNNASATPMNTLQQPTSFLPLSSHSGMDTSSIGHQNQAEPVSATYANTSATKTLSNPPGFERFPLNTASIQPPPGFSMFGQPPVSNFNSPWSNVVNSQFRPMNNPQPVHQSAFHNLRQEQTQQPVNWLGQNRPMPFVYGNQPTASSPAWFGTEAESDRQHTWSNLTEKNNHTNW